MNMHMFIELTKHLNKINSVTKMKEVTAILLILIAVIGIISIIIVKLYYREKEKDNDKEKLEEFINSTRSEYDEEKRRRVRRSPNRPRANLSEAQLYANTIDDVENGEMGSTTALLRQRAKSMEEAPKKQPRRTKTPNKDVVTLLEYDGI